MAKRGNVYLIGPMGSGKTAVGKRLAALLGKQFFDSDAEIERRTGVDIRYIFEKEGEARFREREREVIADLTALDGRRRRDGRRRGARPREPRAAREHGHRRVPASHGRRAARAHAAVTEPAVADERRPARRARATARRYADRSTRRSPTSRVDTTGRQVARRRGRRASLARRAGLAALQIRKSPANLRAVETITVALGERSYPIHIGPRLIGDGSLYGVRAKQILDRHATRSSRRSISHAVRAALRDRDVRDARPARRRAAQDARDVRERSSTGSSTRASTATAA